jgi:hypothetical protein
VISELHPRLVAPFAGLVENFGHPFVIVGVKGGCERLPGCADHRLRGTGPMSGEPLGAAVAARRLQASNLNGFPQFRRLLMLEAVDLDFLIAYGGNLGECAFQILCRLLTNGIELKSDW